MKICQASWCHGQDSHQVSSSEPIPSVELYNIIHHCYQNNCLIHIPVYHTLAVTTILCRYIYCMPAKAITCTAPFISTALHLAKNTSADVNAQSIRWWASYDGEDPINTPNSSPQFTQVPLQEPRGPFTRSNKTSTGVYFTHWASLSPMQQDPLILVSSIRLNHPH